MPKSQNLSYLFETSWEVCNKVGGIYTVVSTKVPNMEKIFGERYFLIGPDVWKGKYNKEFIEDKELYADWHKYAESQGINFRIGHWAIAGSPVVILVDFMSQIANKDAILAEFWESYKLDSLSGQWDYIEPVLFGYTAAKVVESFYQHQVYPQERIYAHFHEWMTGAGVLYLKKNTPQIATVFTTHATVIGRCIAGNSLPLYSELSNYNAEELSYDFGVRAKFSMEKLSALHADSFTTVSEITDNECNQFFGKAVDVITENGFEDAFVPKGEKFTSARTFAKEKLVSVTQALLNQKIDEDALFIINSGRYEFKNKGIDLFIDALAVANKNQKLRKQIVAYLTIPADSAGARHDVLERVSSPDYANPVQNDYSTHYLNNADHDAIIQRLRSVGLHNAPEDKVKVIFVPCYLDGRDGIFNMSYYDLLIGFDASAFPSYYEPWGYTPLESIAFGIPTLSTTLAGFGQWVNDSYSKKQMGVYIVERTDTNDMEVVNEIAHFFEKLSEADAQAMETYRKNAYDISRIALWDNLVEKYVQAYQFASQKWVSNKSLLNKVMPRAALQYAPVVNTYPEWRKIIIKPNTPEKLMKLDELSKNLWWSWNHEAEDLFKSIDEDLWESVQQNPIDLLTKLNSSQIKELENDTIFHERLDAIYAVFRSYMDEPKIVNQPQVAYFSMEFGLHQSLKIYSGGLGILAGDYLKAASDKNVDMIGVGLLYRYGYFHQRISNTGEQIAGSIPQQFSKLPLEPVRNANGEWLMISLSFPGRKIYAKIWRVPVGRVSLYLLDTDIDENSEIDRSVTHHLYGGDWENRFKQELLLGVGGIRAIRKLGLHPQVYHCNEGHAAFIGVERLREYIESENKTFYQAKELVRFSSLFTTHTPVPAGHDEFSEDLVRTYISHYPQRLNISWDNFMALGRENANLTHAKFSMSCLAANLSQEINGVSRIHGRVSREIFSNMYPGYYPEELHIGYVTNGVHYKTWANEKWQRLYEASFGSHFMQDVSNPENWAKIYEVSDSDIWNIRTDLRTDLINFAKQRLRVELTRRDTNPQGLLKVLESLKPEVLTIGFARRFATYKRAHLLFSNMERLKAIVNNKQQPVQFIFAGKAHPADKAGQDLIKRIVEVAKMPDFLGKIIFLENYDVEVAKKMVQGVDIWMNTPTRPLEASGTSGEKAIMNGVLNLSVLDGWWAEGYKKHAGWALREEQTYENSYFQDELDAEAIYFYIENEIAPAYYAQDAEGISSKWISYIKKNIAEIAPHFTMRRQLDDYYKQYYLNLYERSIKMNANDGELALTLARWKIKVLNNWENIKPISCSCPDATNSPLLMGDPCHFEISLDLGVLTTDDIGVEIIFGQKRNDKVESIIYKQMLSPVNQNGSEATYRCNITTDNSGVFDYAFRIFPKNENLVYRQDFNLVKWV